MRDVSRSWKMILGRRGKSWKSLGPVGGLGFCVRVYLRFFPQLGPVRLSRVSFFLRFLMYFENLYSPYNGSSIKFKKET